MTTTCFISVRFWRRGGAAAIALLAVASADAAASAQAYRAPRTTFGAPSLEGVWTNSSITMLQRPPNLKNLLATEAEARAVETGFRSMVGDLLRTHVDPEAPAPPVVKEAPAADILEMDMHLATIDGRLRSSWIVEPADGRIPFSDEGRRARKAATMESLDGPEQRPLAERCLTAIGSPEGPPMMNAAFNAHYQIVQTRDVVAIQIEMNHDVRLIRMSSREHRPDHVRQWMGDSIGWWEGDALLVETTDFDLRAGIDSFGGGFTYGPRTKVIERFERTGTDRLLYSFTVTDPDYLQQPFRGEMPMRAAQGPIFEYACHEGNYSVPNVLGGARVQEQATVSAAKSPM